MKKAIKVSKSTKCLVCAECVGDNYLKGVIESSVSEGQCSNGHQSSKATNVENIVEHVKGLFDRHFIETSDSEGDTVTEIIQQYARVSDDLADEIQICLEKGHGVTESGKSFSKGEKYKLNEDSASTWSKKWDELQDIIRYRNRALNRKSREILDTVIGEILRTKRKNVVTEIGSEAEVSGKGKQLNVFRARIFESEEGLMNALENIDDEMGPPPSEKARPGRLNASGISVVYCATRAEIAVAEVRPPVGSLVLMTTFIVKGKFLLLDIESLQRYATRKEESMFDPKYTEKKERTAFLAEFCENISAPVVPSNVETEYLVTQVIADYLSDFDIDGIMYSSSQRLDVEEIGKNIMIFNKSSKIGNRDVSREDGYQDARLVTDDEKESHYLVRELKLDESEKKIYCGKDNTLTVDTDGVQVLEVNRIEYKRSEIKVKFVSGKPEDFAKKSSS